MQRLYDLKSKLNNLTINTTSVPSSSTDTSMQNTRNSSQNGPRPKYPIRKPTMRLFPETQNIKPLPTVRIVTKHSHGFNSERATGLDKLQQLQFVQQLKDMIVEEAPLLHGHFAKYTTYRVITIRKSGGLPESPVTSFVNDMFYVAKLFAVTAACNGWTLLEQSEETEYLTDAVEDLWEKVMSRVGVETEGVKIGESVSVDRRKVEKNGNRMSIGW